MKINVNIVDKKIMNKNDIYLNKLNNKFCDIFKSIFKILKYSEFFS